MSLELDNQPSQGYGLSSEISESYEASVASSVPSTQTSVFSDSLSAQSSIASSISDDFRGGQEDARERDRVCAQVQLQYQAKNNLLPREEPSLIGNLLRADCPSYAEVTSVPVLQRQHPRRRSLSKSHKPPPLIRQRDRKINFVDNLVDSATQMVEVIWPLSIVPCRSESGSRGVLPLRTYIEETLRRSRTSYSTLQVALYYLVLIRPHVPNNDFTMEQDVECSTDRALMCGRRMFLAALILASKYLQDRNYSAKAWSKMSGLRVCEINTNERVFLGKIDWKLHISKPTFERWQEIVLRYTPNPPSSPGLGAAPSTSMWKTMVPVLTPALDNIPAMGSPLKLVGNGIEAYGFSSPATPTPTPSHQSLKAMTLETTSQGTTPTPFTICPRYLEPNSDVQPPTPALARLGPLPTPSMTPSSVASSTPAVSACGSRRSSISSAWAMAQKSSMNRCALDTYPPQVDSRPMLSRRPSIMSAYSSGSSPESMISDHSRTSRSSSISSLSAYSTVSSVAPQRACLARQATCRNAGLPPLKLVKEEMDGTAMKPIVIDDDVDMTSNPLTADFSVKEKVLHAPHRHSRTSKHTAQPIATAISSDKSRKRSRTHGQRRSDLQDEVRWQLEESIEDAEMDLDDDDFVASQSTAAEYASDMLNSDYHIAICKEPQPPAPQSCRESSWVPAPRSEGRKRTCCSARTTSASPSHLYREVI